MVLCSDTSRAAVDMDQKTVLVQLGERARTLVFAGGDGDDVARATEATRAKYSDVLRPAEEIVLQLKDEEWGGIFVDMAGRGDSQSKCFKGCSHPLVLIPTLTGSLRGGGYCTASEAIPTSDLGQPEVGGVGTTIDRRIMFKIITTCSSDVDIRILF